ncbi:PIN domain-containing protein [Desulfofustis limnaeus]|uniref:Twitching motility protein PilT n=1 Tax=Desulfofustis limnaeus TaxID=2740163 RepID=A0ABN6M608_9BACT|nr:PIN domain-containing protein [Desulfofustis limnaeus]BDD87655.1 twitching motility protein PilT [Desulfofustis limnaeus]
MILVDSSVWIDYFRSGEHTGLLDQYLEEDVIVINDLILAELIPFLQVRKQKQIISLLTSIHNQKLTIAWDQLIAFQYSCLMAGINGIGIPHLIIAQHAIQNNFILYSLDRHFSLIQRVIPALELTQRAIRSDAT